MRGEAPKKLAEDGKKSKRYPVDISITFTIQLRNSSDSDLGRRPMPKSDEFSTCIAKGVEISALLYPKTLQKVIHFMGASPLRPPHGTKSQRTDV